MKCNNCARERSGKLKIQFSSQLIVGFPIIYHFYIFLCILLFIIPSSIEFLCLLLVM